MHRPQRADSSGAPSVALYTIADSEFFPGVVALLNSLRLTGCQHPLYVLDCGFTDEQRHLLSGHCQLAQPPALGAINPTQYKPFAPLHRPSGVVVIIDSDIIVTRPLEPVVRLAQEGHICAFPDPESHRWFPEWQQLLDLRAPLRREPYVNAGFVAWSTTHWPDFLERWWQCCRLTFEHRTIREGAPNSDPLAQADQDALNALLMSEIPTGALTLLPKEEEVFRWDLRKVSVVDPHTLACRYAGQSVMLLHSNGGTKLWNGRAWRRVTRRNAYLRLLRRLLTGSDVALRLPLRRLPVWLRPQRAARAATFLLYGLNVVISVVLQ